MDLLYTLIGRSADVAAIHKLAGRGHSVSVVGVSNIGKSALLRRLCQNAPNGTFVYVDCNQMGERSARAFFTSIWFAILQLIQARSLSNEIKARAAALYDEIIHASNTEFVTPQFDEGFTLAMANLPRPLVLCFDEFDEAYKHLEPQTFLNLRALKDRYGEALAYVVATEREITRLPATREQGEFLELIASHVHFMHFMEPADTRVFCNQFAAQEGVTFSESDLAFIIDNADGHPGLAQAVCCALGAVTGAPKRDKDQDRVIHQMVQLNLTTDSNVRSECEKVWDDLDQDEREALQVLHPTSDQAQIAQRSLRHKFIIRESKDEVIIFSRLFAEFIRQQKIKQQPSAGGVFIDVGSERVWVDGKEIEGLTDLEYRLLLFFYGRIDHVCDKYKIVESVWGEDYIDKVDDARIEKLVSRVRQKIEPDATKPRYLISVRGRGYKLVR
ncbi:MAG: winged helix-turn-helix domain-containing protein [Chloroflexi bacterium]|nr:winged helix-turn-helix domain-containing protein [Chloroflexota bacterium]